MKNLYKPFKVKITKIEKHSDNVNLLRLEKDDLFKKDEKGLVFNPGQFILISHFG